MNFIPKSPSDVIPMIFDYRLRLGARPRVGPEHASEVNQPAGLAAGATIQSVDLLTVSPPGELSIGVVGDALIDELSQLEVAVVVTGGTALRIYACTCRSTILHSGGEYVFDVVNYVLVR